MMSLSDALYFLDTTATVSAPSITREQAAELALFIRAQEEALEYERNERDKLDQLVHKEGIPTTTDEAREFWHKIRSLKHQLDEMECRKEEVEDALDYANDVACGFAWDCGSELASQTEWLQYRLLAWVKAEKEWVGSQQQACGFAWDVGREIADLEWRKSLLRDCGKPVPEGRSAPNCNAWGIACMRHADDWLTDVIHSNGELKLKLKESEAHLRLERESNANLLACVADLESDRATRERKEQGLSVEANTTTWGEATGDLDPGVYEGTGKGFEE